MWSDSDTLTDAPIAISGNNATFAGNISAVGGSFTNPVTIYDVAATENPRLSIGRQAAESLQFDVEDTIATIRHKQDADSNTGHFLDFIIDSTSTGNKQYRFKQAGNTSSTYLTLDSSAATFAGDITTNGDITIDNSSGDPFLKLKTTAQEYVARIDQSDSEKFQIRDTTNSATRLTIDTSGNVGIGTTSPGKKLHVAGEISGSAIQVIGGSSTNKFYSTNTGAIAEFKPSDSRSGMQPILLYRSTVNGSANYLLANGNTTLFGLYDSGVPSDNSGMVRITPNNSSEAPAVRIGDAGSNGAYLDVGGNIKLLNDGSSYINGGNVGIGTTSPGASLHVASTTSDYVAKFSHTTATGYAPGSILLQAGQSTSRGQGLFHYNTEADDSWFTGVPYNVNSTKWIVAHKPDTTFNPDVAQLSHAIFTIDSATDNVGIGESSPLTRLHVKANDTDGTKSVYGVALIEKADAQLDLLSTSDGTWGSAINFIEAAGSGANTDIWSIARKTTGGNGDSSLNFNFGTANQHDNTNRFKISSAGDITVPGGDITISSAKIKYQQNTDVDSAAAETIASVDTGSFAGAFFDYTCVSGSNARAGIVMAVNVNGSVEFTDNSTKDIGNTSGVTLSVDISGGSMRLRATTTTDNWTIKSLVRAL